MQDVQMTLDLEETFGWYTDFIQDLPSVFYLSPCDDQLTNDHWYLIQAYARENPTEVANTPLDRYKVIYLYDDMDAIGITRCCKFCDETDHDCMCDICNHCDLPKEQADGKDHDLCDCEICDRCDRLMEDCNFCFECDNCGSSCNCDDDSLVTDYDYSVECFAPIGTQYQSELTIPWHEYERLDGGSFGTVFVKRGSPRGKYAIKVGRIRNAFDDLDKQIRGAQIGLCPTIYTVISSVDLDSLPAFIRSKIPLRHIYHGNLVDIMISRRAIPYSYYKHDVDIDEEILKLTRKAASLGLFWRDSYERNIGICGKNWKILDF